MVISSLATHVAALVAELDLIKIQDVIKAIRAADAQSELATGPLHVRPAVIYEPRQHVQPQVTYENRPRIHPEPRYENRPVHHPAEARDNEGLSDSAPLVAVRHGSSICPIEPPWKSLPYPQVNHVTLKVKLALRQPDLMSKGSLLDCMM